MMRNLIFILFIILSNPLHSQKKDGLWVNCDLRTAILKDSLTNYEDSYIPMMISIKNNKVALFFQMEPSSLSYSKIKKTETNKYKNKLGEFSFKDSVLIYNNSKKEIRFIKGNLNENEFNTTYILTKKHINYPKINELIDVETQKTSSIKCNSANNNIFCSTSAIQFTYTIFNSNPYYFKGKFNQLKYYMKINFGGFTKTYLIKKESAKIILSDISNNKDIYILK